MASRVFWAYVVHETPWSLVRWLHTRRQTRGRTPQPPGHGPPGDISPPRLLRLSGILIEAESSEGGEGVPVPRAARVRHTACASCRRQIQ